MQQGFTVLAALGMSGNIFRVRDEFPGKPGSTISRMILNGTDLEILGHERGKGFHLRLPPPQIMFVLEQADLESWRDSMRELEGRAFGAIITPSTSPDVETPTWAVNAPVPSFIKDESLPMTIVKAVADEYGSANVFASPTPSSEWAKLGMYFRFTFLPLTGWMGLTEGVPMDQFMALEEALELEASGEDEDEDDEEEGEESDGDDVVQTHALPQPPAPEPPAPRRSFLPIPPAPPPEEEKPVATVSNGESVQ